MQDLPQDIDYEYFSYIDRVNESCVFFYSSFSEVYDVIKSLNNKANPLFDIGRKLLENISETFIPIFAYLFNLCLL